jgi:hypothetical protein
LCDAWQNLRFAHRIIATQRRTFHISGERLLKLPLVFIKEFSCALLLSKMKTALAKTSNLLNGYKLLRNGRRTCGDSFGKDVEFTEWIQITAEWPAHLLQVGC